MNGSKIDLEKFMSDIYKGTGFTFNAFHTVFRYVNERYFGGALYKQIKNGDVSAQEIISLMKKAGK